MRIVEYTLTGVAHAEPLYRLVTTVLDPDSAPAPELAALYHERWEIETALAELKTHLRGARIVLRGKTPCAGSAGVLRLVARSLRRLWPHARGRPQSRRGPRPAFLPSQCPGAPAQTSGLGFSSPPQDHPAFHDATLDEILQERVVSSRGRTVPRGVKRKMSNFPLRPRRPMPTTRVTLGIIVWKPK